MYSHISFQSFQECGQELYERNISYTYNYIEKKTFEKHHENLMNELHLVNNEINELDTNINNLTKKLNRSIYHNFRTKMRINDMKQDMKNKKHEKNILLLDIETTEKQINEIKCKIEDYFRL